MRLTAAVAILAELAWLAMAAAQTPANTNPAVGTKLTGCVEGRALRIVNGMPSCTPTGVPTLSGCGSGTIDSIATDFTGQVTLPAGLTTCTIVLTKLYSVNFVCLVGAQKAAITINLGAPTVGNNGSNTTIQVPFGLSLTGASFGYFCAPG